MAGYIRPFGADVTNVLTHMAQIITDRLRPTPTTQSSAMLGADLTKSEQMCGDRTCGEAGAPLNGHPSFQFYRTGTTVPSVNMREEGRGGLQGPASFKPQVVSPGNTGAVVSAAPAHIMAGKNSSAPKKMQMMLVKS